ncbi:unnamed protein product [Owenia fusiformis]|uniref:Uncharacterized protein n=1 Tax=Owenia fusiformis TaxID=6347 RepID=A0A8S4Q693_OWEFU|nr:unnamed protein product [Owenia fusiformis]
MQSVKMDVKQYLLFTLTIVVSCCCISYMFLYIHLQWKDNAIHPGRFKYKQWHKLQLSKRAKEHKQGMNLKMQQSRPEAKMPLYGGKDRKVEQRLNQKIEQSRPGAKMPLYGRKDKKVEQRLNQKIEQSRPGEKMPLYGRKDRKVDGEERFKLQCMLPGYETKYRNERLIIYSKIPKCGGTTLRELFENSCLRTQKCYHMSQHNMTLKLGIKETRKKYQKYLNGLTSNNDNLIPTIISTHVQFLDFSDSNLKQPLFIDILRDPLERWISLYYFTRSSGFQQKVHNIPDSDINTKLGDCLIRSNIFRARCNMPTGCNSAQRQLLLNARKESPQYCFKPKPYIEWFSGHTNAYINKAKQYIEKYYTFLGILEHFSESIEALQKIFGIFGNDLVDLNNRMPKMNVAKNKLRPSNDTIALMKEFLADDYVIYEFALQRFYTQLKCLGINIEHKLLK